MKQQQQPFPPPPPPPPLTPLIALPPLCPLLSSPVFSSVFVAPCNQALDKLGDDKGLPRRRSQHSSSSSFWNINMNSREKIRTIGDLHNGTVDLCVPFPVGSTHFLPFFFFFWGAAAKMLKLYQWRRTPKRTLRWFRRKIHVIAVSKWSVSGTTNDSINIGSSTLTLVLPLAVEVEEGLELVVAHHHLRARVPRTLSEEILNSEVNIDKKKWVNLQCVIQVNIPRLEI